MQKTVSKLRQASEYFKALAPMAKQIAYHAGMLFSYLADAQDAVSGSPGTPEGAWEEEDDPR